MGALGEAPTMACTLYATTHRGTALPLVDVLIPTYRRKTGLAMVLTSLIGQSAKGFDVIVSDQTEEEHCYLDSPEVQAAKRALEWRGHRVRLLRNLPRRGLAQQRQFLLDQSEAKYVHFLDDDVILEPDVLARMLEVIRGEGCGFVGAAATGLQFLGDRREARNTVELWTGPVTPEPFEPGNVPWERHRVNSAANPLHLEQELVVNGQTVRYKVAWIGGANVIYDREKLRSVGGFAFWDRLPVEHAGEEAVVQFMLVRKYGGCGVLPSGTYHVGLPTLVPDRETNATQLFGELIAEREGAESRPAAT